MTATGDICLVSPATAAALDALLLLAVQKASEVIASGVLEPKDTIAAVKVVAEAAKAASEVVSKGNGVAPKPRAHPAFSDASPANGPPIYTLNDAVAAVCERDADTKALVPWARVICRIHRLCNMVEEQIAEHRGEPVSETVHKTTNEMAEELAEKYDVPFSPSRMPAYEKKLRDYEREKKARAKAARAENRAGNVTLTGAATSDGGEYGGLEGDYDNGYPEGYEHDFSEDSYPPNVPPIDPSRATLADVYEEIIAKDPAHPLHAFLNPDGTLRSHDAAGNPRPRYYPDNDGDDGENDDYGNGDYPPAFHNDDPSAPCDGDPSAPT